MEDNATCHKSNIIKNRRGNKPKAKTALLDEEIDILFEKKRHGNKFSAVPSEHSLAE